MKLKEFRKTLKTFGATKQEVKVGVLVLRGLPDKVISKKLSIAESTVRFHFSNVMTKLNLSIRSRDFFKHVYDHYANPEIYGNTVKWKD